MHCTDKYVNKWWPDVCLLLGQNLFGALPITAQCFVVQSKAEKRPPPTPTMVGCLIGLLIKFDRTAVA